MNCEVCGYQDKSPTTMVEDVELMVEHLRVFHPEEYGDGPERWPDGAVVLHDETLTPEEFS